MGCTIHLYAEKKNSNGRWETIDEWVRDEDGYVKVPRHPEDKRTYTHGRNYNLFTALCGVTSYMFNGDPPIVSKPKGVPEDVCFQVLQVIKRWEGDGHNHSWNTLKELKEFDWSSYGATCDDFRNEVIPKLEAHNVDPEDIRIVYFFDN